MVQRLLSRIRESSDDEVAAGLPFYLLLFLVMVVGYGVVLASDEPLRQPGRWALFTGLMLVHGVLHWFSMRLTRQRRWLPAYFLVQGGLVLAIGYLASFQGLILGLYMALVGETAGMLWPDLRAIALSASFYVILMVLNVVLLWGGQALAQLAPILGLMLAFVLIYVALFVRQVEARERAVELLQELEGAHRQLQEYAAQVEELTISQERQRLARELHDTLAQGLAGLILQLEAADSHLEGGNQARAQAVVQQAMQRARTTLHEARRAIQALRSTALEQDSLVAAVGREVDQFKATTGLQTTFEVSAELPSLSPETAQDILRIVQEGLSNVARHAQAGHVLVRLIKRGEGLRVVVQDDGLGFDPAEGLDQPGRFGLAGMRERALSMGGNLSVESAPGRGTRLTLDMDGGAS